MAPGPTIRRLLGARLARAASRRYRAVFVDLEKLADILAGTIPEDAHILDVGGGDGELLNALLRRRQDLRVTTIDTAAIVAQYLDSQFEARVIRLPQTSLSDYLAKGAPDPQVVLFSDVFHHISPSARPVVLRCLGVLLDRIPALKIIVKDIEPGSWRAWLARWTDYYITGDKGVSPISCRELVHLFTRELGPLCHEESTLMLQDAPNYAISFSRSPAR